MTAITELQDFGIGTCTQNCSKAECVQWRLIIPITWISGASAQQTIKTIHKIQLKTYQIDTNHKKNS